MDLIITHSTNHGARMDIIITLSTSEQHKMAKASMETTPVQSLSVPKRTPLKAVPETVRNMAPPALGGTPPQKRQTWPGPPSDHHLRWRDTPRSDHTFHSIRESDRVFDANPSWNPKERVIIRGMEDYLG